MDKINGLVKLRLNFKGIGKLLKGEEVKKLISNEAFMMKSRAGEGYAYRVHNTGQRQAANIYPATEEARQDNLRNNTLLKSMKGGSG